MQKLRFAGVSDDGQHLVLETWDGEQQFHTVIDQTLRNAVVKARKAPPARPPKGDGAFGPRGIQARFRQGATVDEIVAESGWKPERVRRYEWPILAERHHMVTAARQAEVEPLDGSGARTLNNQVVAVRETWNFADGDAQWNSWQREDGLWNVSVSVDYSRPALDRIPEGSDFPARFVFNPHNQALQAGNAVAEFLLGRLPEDAGQESAPVAPVPAADAEEPVREISEAEPSAPQGPAPADGAVRTNDSEDSENTESGTAAVESESVEPSAATSGNRGGRSGHTLRAVPDRRPTDQERLLNELDSRRGTRGGEDPASDARVRDLTARLSPEEDSAWDARDTEQEPGGQDPQEESSRSRGRAKRPSVPSWDDIVFGSKH